MKKRQNYIIMIVSYDKNKSIALSFGQISITPTVTDGILYKPFFRFHIIHPRQKGRERMITRGCMMATTFAIWVST